MQKRKGFSLVEVLVYTAIIGVVGTLMNGVLISLLKIQNKQTATTEVTQQVNFLILNIQRHIRESSSINMPDNTDETVLNLRKTNAAKDPTLIYRTGTTAYIKEGASSEVPLTTDDVTVDALQFKKISSATGYNLIQFTITMSYNSQNPQRVFTKTITSSVAHPNPQ